MGDIDFKRVLAAGLGRVGGSSLEQLELDAVRKRQMEEERRRQELTSGLGILSQMPSANLGQALDLSSLTFPQIEAMKGQGMIKNIGGGPGYEINPQSPAVGIVEQARLQQGLQREESKAGTEKAKAQVEDIERNRQKVAMIDTYTQMRVLGNTGSPAAQQIKKGLILAHGYDPEALELKSRLQAEGQKLAQSLIERGKASPGMVSGFNPETGYIAFQNMNAQGDGKDPLKDFDDVFKDHQKTMNNVAMTFAQIEADPSYSDRERLALKEQLLTTPQTGLADQLLAYNMYQFLRAPELWELNTRSLRAAAGVAPDDNSPDAVAKITQFQFEQVKAALLAGKKPSEISWFAKAVEMFKQVMVGNPTGKKPETKKDATRLRESLFSE